MSYMPESIQDMYKDFMKDNLKHKFESEKWVRFFFWTCFILIYKTVCEGQLQAYK